MSYYPDGFDPDYYEDCTFDRPKPQEWEDLENQLNEAIEWISHMADSKNYDEIETCLQELCCVVGVEYNVHRCNREVI